LTLAATDYGDCRGAFFSSLFCRVTKKGLAHQRCSLKRSTDLKMREIYTTSFSYWGKIEREALFKMGFIFLAMRQMAQAYPPTDLYGF